MFPLHFRTGVRMVSKITSGEFSTDHRQVITQAEYQNGQLTFPGSRWEAFLLGSGEEKAVFCVCDQADRVFALEVIDQKTYLDGRFVGGTYFYETSVPGLGNVKLNPHALLGLTFTGLVKAREFVHGYEWARFQFSPQNRSWLDLILTHWLQGLFAGQFNDWRSRYKDVHDRNVMFEIRPAGQKGIPILAKDWSNKLRRVRVGIQPIDVR